MTYRVLADARVAKSLAKLPRGAVEKIDKVVGRLSEDPRPADEPCLRGEHR